MIRSKWLAVALIPAAAASLCPAYLHADERILDYRADILVGKDSSVSITETITVRAEGKKIKRGIFRDLPTTYRHPYWGRLRVGYDVLEVTRDGNAEPWHTSTERSGYKRIYIGRKSKQIKKGRHTYAITYRPTRRMLGYFENHDELYWNVTGNDWDFPIDKASATVTLPDGIPADRITHEAYTGKRNKKGENYVSLVDSGGLVRFATKRPMAKGEGLTIVAAFPKGFVEPPSDSERLMYFLMDNAMVLVGGVGTIVILLYYFFAWLKVGRDPDRGVIFPHFEPPAGLDPASVRYVLRMAYDKTCLAAAILGLAVKRRLRIEDDDGDYTLHNEPEAATEGLSRGETKVHNRLFDSGDRLRLHKKNHAAVKDVITGLKKVLASDYKGKNKLFVTNIGWFIVGAVLTVATILGSVLSNVVLGGGEPAVLFLGLWLSLWTLGCVALLRQVLSNWAEVRRSRGLGKVGSAGAAIFITLFAIPFLVAEIVVLGFLVYMTSILLLPILIVLIVANGWFFQLLKQPTREGRKVMDQIEGFRMYLATAEGETIAAAKAPTKTPELFEKYLPYALALDVENRWAEQFESVLTAAAADPQSSYRPGWYHGSTIGAFSAGALAGSISTSFSSALSSASTAPGSSSGSGGGGSSGGGGGGGGGGGW